MRILDVGCGASKFEGSIGIDRLNMPEVDVVWELDNLPWPFEDKSFERIIFKHAIMHLSDISKVMDEVYRLLNDDGTVEILAPHYSSDNSFTDPTHKFSLGIRSMNYFCDNLPNWKYNYSDNLFKLNTCYISFLQCNVDFNKQGYKSRTNFFKLIGIEFFANKFPRLYEKYLCNYIPANEVYFNLVKGKG